MSEQASFANTLKIDLEFDSEKHAGIMKAVLDANPELKPSLITRQISVLPEGLLRIEFRSNDARMLRVASCSLLEIIETVVESMEMFHPTMKCTPVKEKHLHLEAELELTKRAILKIRSERNLLLDRIYQEEFSRKSGIDIGGISDEDLGMEVPGEDSAEWIELEAMLQKKNLVPVVAAKLPSKRKPSVTAAAPRSPKRQASVPNAEEEEVQASAPATAKPKRIVKTAEASAAQPRRAQSIPLDAQGKPVLPITCGIVTVHTLGQVITDRQSYHNKRYVWPVGFHSSRQYLSVTNPDGMSTYHSQVLDGGPAPIFEVWPEDAPDRRFQSATSTGVWTAVFKAAAAVRSKDPTNSASGPDFFGFSNSTIAMMVEMLPGVDSCFNYQRKNFLEAANNKARASAAASSSQPLGDSNNPAEEEEDDDEGHLDLFDLATRAMQQI